MAPSYWLKDHVQGIDWSHLATPQTSRATVYTQGWSARRMNRGHDGHGQVDADTPCESHPGGLILDAV